MDDLFGDVEATNVPASSDIITKMEDEMDRDGGAFSSKRVNKVVLDPNDDLFATKPLSSAPKKQTSANIFDDLFSDSGTKTEAKPSGTSAGLFSDSPKTKKATKPADSSIFDNPPEDIFASSSRSSNTVDIFADEKPSTSKVKTDDTASASKPSQVQRHVEGPSTEAGGMDIGEVQSQVVSTGFV